MTRRMTALLMGVALLAALALPMAAQAQTSSQRFWVQAVDIERNPVTSTGTVLRVYNAGTNTDATIYTDGTLATAAANPVVCSGVTGDCSFYANSTPASYDVVLYVVQGPYKGVRVRIPGLTRQNTHIAVLSRPQAGTRVLVTSLTGGATQADVATNATLPVGSLIREVILETQTAVATSVFNAGAPGIGAAGLCGGQSTAVVGFINCSAPNSLIATQAAITMNSQGHASKVYLYTYYDESGNSTTD